MCVNANGRWRCERANRKRRRQRPPKLRRRFIDFLSNGICSKFLYIPYNRVLCVNAYVLKHMCGNMFACKSGAFMTHTDTSTYGACGVRSTRPFFKLHSYRIDKKKCWKQVENSHPIRGRSERKERCSQASKRTSGYFVQFDKQVINSNKPYAYSRIDNVDVRKFERAIRIHASCEDVPRKYHQAQISICCDFNNNVVFFVRDTSSLTATTIIIISSHSQHTRPKIINYIRQRSARNQP